MKRKVLKVNLEKSKMMVTGGKLEDVIQVGVYPCEVCDHGVGPTLLCGTHGKWCHKRCLGMRSPSVAAVCVQCGAVGVGGGVVSREVKLFCYFNDVCIGLQGAAEGAIRTRSWGCIEKIKRNISFLVMRDISLLQALRYTSLA